MKPNINQELLEYLKQYRNFYDFYYKNMDFVSHEFANAEIIEGKYGVYIGEILSKIYVWLHNHHENFNQKELDFLYTTTQYYSFRMKPEELTLYRGITNSEDRNLLYRITDRGNYIKRIKNEKKISTNKLTSFSLSHHKARYFTYGDGIVISVKVPSTKVVASYYDWFNEINNTNNDEMEYMLYNIDVLECEIVGTSY